MIKRILKILLVLGFMLSGFIIGLIVGIQIGGNYFTSFVFLGQRGYEATGLIGSWIGLGLFGYLGYRLVR
ncbi:MAG: hypothetical protein KGZ38_08265 [Erysipelothrix sp.]|nr:hypothetical protein [Erysipelothrix sp.]